MKNEADNLNHIRFLRSQKGLPCHGCARAPLPAKCSTALPSQARPAKARSGIELARAMSLVDYASSSGEEDDNVDDVAAEATTTASAAAPAQRPQGAAPFPPPPRPPPHEDCAPRVATEASMPSNNATSSAMSSIKLPDASLLFASPSFPSPTIAGNDHASRVAAAMSANVSRKREANGKATQLPQNKHPRGSFPPRYVPGRSSSLIPPQLLGRSNVVTEDMSKLFVNRRPPS